LALTYFSHRDKWKNCRDMGGIMATLQVALYLSG